MKSRLHFLTGLLLTLCLLCTACGSTDEPVSPVDDPNEGLGGGLSEDTVNDFSVFEGIWYYDGDLSAETYIVIDGSGNWTYYQRAPGAEPAEMDCGTFSYSTDEVSTYYADSTTYAGVSYRVFEVDEDSLVWGDEGVYYLME